MMEWIPFCKQRIIDLVYNIKSSNLLRARLKEHPGVVNTRLLATGVGPGTGQDKMEHETSRASGYLCIGSEAGTLKWITNSSWDSLGGGGGARGELRMQERGIRGEGERDCGVFCLL